MDERAALAVVADAVPAAGDDAATVDGTVITTDMLHERTDFPAGTTRYTAGWRAVGASLSDVAATGGRATAAVAVYAAPTFEERELRAFLAGASDVCTAVDAAYVGGDLDHHEEFTVATTALGQTDDPVGRDGAAPGDLVCVTGPLGRTAAAVPLFETDPERANELFRFTPRVAAGVALAEHATAMTDSSDGLARSAHLIAAAAGRRLALEGDAVPVHDALREVVADPLARATTYGEDFELVCTLPPAALEAARASVPGLTVVGEVTADEPGGGSRVTMDGEPLADEGYTHGTATEG